MSPRAGGRSGGHSPAEHARVEVAVVGGGLVGATLACALAEAGIEVAVVDANAAVEAPRGGDFDLRVSAVNLASEHVFRSLGAWSHLPQERIGPFREMRVWDAAGTGAIHFDAAELGEPALGYIVENRALQYALERRASGHAGIHWYRPAVLETLEIGTDGVRLHLEGDEGGTGRRRARHIDARLVVGADGTSSRVRRQSGLAAAREDYGQTAVVASVRTELDHAETAWQRFLPDGPLAFLPLPGGRSSIVWSTTPDRAQALRALPEDAFRMELETAFDRRLGMVTEVGARGAFPLRRLRAREYVRDRVALAGDAAHTIHPLAGQGANLGFLDAATLAQVLAEARADGRDIGSRAVLRRYERWRKGHNFAAQIAMDGFRALFGSRLPPVRVARNLGLELTDRMGPVKHLIMEYATGLAGDLPERARFAPARGGA